MKTADLKIEIFRKVDALDASKLQEFYGLMLNFINSKRDTDEWIGVTESEKNGIESAITELEAGKGISHATIMQNFRTKYAND